MRNMNELFGVYVARVVDVRDPENLGRVRVRMPLERSVEAWARVATLFAGDGHGSWFVPDVDAEVVVAFEGGDPKRPIVVGSLWKAGDRPPESMDAAGDNRRRVLRSRTGVQITLDDEKDRQELLLETPGGQKITLRDGPGAIQVADSNGNSVTFEASGLTVSAAAKVTIQASQVAISAGAVTVEAGMAKFSGVVQADAVITNSVVSASYTPGAGNIL